MALAHRRGARRRARRHPEYVGFVGDEVWWTEPRPTEGGRRALVRRRADGDQESVLHAPWNVRSRVMEYGGQAVGRRHARRRAAGRVRQLRRPAAVLLAEAAANRARSPRCPRSAADCAGWSRSCGSERGEVWCVLEEFTGDGPTDVRRVLAAVPLDGSAAQDRDAVRELTDDRHRFVTGPRLSPDGRRAAWLAWDHPRMPWDGTELMVAEVAADGTLARRPARSPGGPDESIAQVDWAADGALLSRQRPLRLVEPVPADRTAMPVCPREEEFGGPLWKVGQSWFAPLEGGLVAVVHGRGATALGVLDPETGDVVDAAGPWTEFAATLAVHGEQGRRRRGESAQRLRGRRAGHPHRAGPGDRRRARRPGRPRATTPSRRSAPSPARTAATIHAHIYPPHHPGYTAPGRRAAPVRRVGARRADRPGARSCSTWRSPTSPRAASASPRSTTAGRPGTGGSTATGCANSGESSTSRTARPSALALADEGTADRDRLADPGRQRGRLDRGGLPHRHRRLRLRHDPLPDPRPRRLGPGETHDFESQYLESLVGPLAEVPGRYWSARPPSTPTDITAPFLLLQGLDDVDLPARAVRAVPRPAAARAGGCRTPTSRSRARGTASGARRRWCARWSPNCPCTPRSSGSNPPGIPTLELPSDPSTPLTRPARGSRPRRPGGRRRAQRARPRGAARGRARHSARLGPRPGRGTPCPGPARASSATSRGRTPTGPPTSRPPGATRRWTPCCAPAAVTARSAWSTCSTGRRMRAAGPKVFVGFSDVTALHEAFAVRLGLVTLHGPMAAGVDFLKDARAQDHLRATLFDPESVRVHRRRGRLALVPGRARGVTLGGCLSHARRRPGHPARPAVARGGLLMIEDVGEERVPDRPGAHPTAARRLARRRRRGRARLVGASAARTRSCAPCSPTGSAALGRAGRGGVRVRALRRGADDAVRGGRRAGRGRGDADAGGTGAAVTRRGAGLSSPSPVRRDLAGARASPVTGPCWPHEPEDLRERRQGRWQGRRCARAADAHRVAVAVLAVLALIFIFENTRSTKIRLLIPEVTMPLWMALLATAVIGALCGAYFMRRRR